MKILTSLSILLLVASTAFYLVCCGVAKLRRKHYKQGMTDAAKIARGFEIGVLAGLGKTADEIEQAILAARDAKKHYDRH